VVDRSQRSCAPDGHLAALGVRRAAPDAGQLVASRVGVVESEREAFDADVAALARFLRGPDITPGAGEPEVGVVTAGLVAVDGRVRGSCRHGSLPGVEDEDRRVFDPPRPVEVKRDGDWWPGWQSRWVRWTPGGPWKASVRYTTGPGSVYVQDVLASRVRPRGE